MKRLIRRIFIGVAALVLGINTNIFSVSAAGFNRMNSALLYVSGYEVTNETITPGEPFALTIMLENFSPNVSAENVMVVIDNPNGVVPEYGTVTQTYIGSVKPRTVEEVTFRYTSVISIQATELKFKVRVISDSYETSTDLIVPVGRMTDFDVISYTVPSEGMVNKTGYASAMVKNQGKTEVNNVVMVARCDGEDIASANVGTMSVGMSKTQYVSVSFAKEGKHTFELLLTYEDDEGQYKEYVISSEMIRVSEDKESIADSQIQDSEKVLTQATENSNGISDGIVIGVSGILLIIVCCVILVLIYRRK